MAILRDTYGRIVPDSAPTYQIAGPAPGSVGSLFISAPNPNYNPNPKPAAAFSTPPPAAVVYQQSGGGIIYANPASVVPPAPAPLPTNRQITFDTIGQVIIRGIGHARYPLQIIWAQGIQESGDITQSKTLTFAAAICAPIDPLEVGSVIGMFDGGSLIFDSGDGGGISPATWSPADAAQLLISLAGTIIYPGDEAQAPADLIVADKGASVTNAFRGIRYIIFPDYPITMGLPSLSIIWQRNNTLSVTRGSGYTGGDSSPSSPGGDSSKPTAAIEFAAGSS